ncbi:MAG: hypothetical protein AAFV43_05440 [Planctomycetota bacterium]
MNPDDIIEILRTSPFQPFVVFLNDGSTFTINHPEQAMIVGDVMYVAHEGRGVRVALINATRVETAEITPPSRS